MRRTERLIGRPFLAITAWVVPLAALALNAPTAVAKPFQHKKPMPVLVEQKDGNQTNAPGQISEATPTCPPRYEAVDGGFKSIDTATNALVVYNSFRSGSQVWQVDAVNLAGSGAATGFVECVRIKAPIVDVTATALTSPAPFNKATVSATCPPPTRDIGGGFDSSINPATGQFAFPETSWWVSPGVWTVTSINNDGPNTVSAHAYCLLGRHIRSMFPEAMSSMDASPFGSVSSFSPRVSVSSKVKGPMEIWGGGFTTSPLGTPAGPIPLISESHPSLPAGSPPGVFSFAESRQTTWQVTAVNLGNPGTVSTNSQAVCVKPPSAKKAKKASHLAVNCQELFSQPTFGFHSKK